MQTLRALRTTASESDRYFLRQAYLAARGSEDPRTNVGSLLLQEEGGRYHIGGTGTNHLDCYVDRDIPQEELVNKLLDRDWKLNHMIHAEHAAIESMLNNGLDTKGSTMYVTLLPCLPCAKMILLAGVKEVISHQTTALLLPEYWYKSIDGALEYLHDHHIDVSLYKGDVGGISCSFSGKTIKP